MSGVLFAPHRFCGSSGPFVLAGAAVWPLPGLKTFRLVVLKAWGQATSNSAAPELVRNADSQARPSCAGVSTGSPGGSDVAEAGKHCRIGLCFHPSCSTGMSNYFDIYCTFSTFNGGQKHTYILRSIYIFFFVMSVFLRIAHVFSAEYHLWLRLSPKTLPRDVSCATLIDLKKKVGSLTG